ncbi:MAG: nucleotide-binding protein [Desulfamplus sp.]|nr:nucleotide-binding protein [Desulfamplus sp.]
MKRNKPKVFIGSSVEGLGVAYSIQYELEHDAEPTVWSQGVFNLTQPVLTELLKCLDQFDAAIFVLTPDDVANIRGKEEMVARDNILFELGLFIGRLGAERTFMVKHRGCGSLHLPTDLLGITPGTYDSARTDGNLRAALGPFCYQVRSQLSKLRLSSEKCESHESEIDIKYNDLMNKLIQLGGYNRLIENQEYVSEKILEPYHSLREEIFKILESDFRQLLEMLASSGIMDVFYGDIYKNEYFTLEIKSVDFLENNFIQFNSSEIGGSSMDIPSNIKDWFGSRYVIEKKEDSKDSE